MKSIELSTLAWHGDKSITLDFPDEWEIQVVGNQVLPALSNDAIQRRLLSPIASQTLSDLASKHHHATILIDDLTRPTPTAELLPLILNRVIQGADTA